MPDNPNRGPFAQPISAEDLLNELFGIEVALGLTPPELIMTGPFAQPISAADMKDSLARIREAIEEGGGVGGSATVWRDGAGVPNNAVGADGDYYLNTANGDVYQRQAGAYVLVGNIQGPEGPAGAEGDPGPAGAEGDPGPAGGAILVTAGATEWDANSRAYPLGPVAGDAPSSQATVVGELWAWPISFARNCTLRRLKARSVGLANARVRFGLCEAAASPAFGPSTLLVDSGNLDASASAVVQSADNLGIALFAGVQYWVLFEVGVAAPNFWSFPSASFGPSRLIGWPDASLAAGVHYNSLVSARAFGAFPADLGSLVWVEAQKSNLPGVFGIFSA